MKGAQPPRLAVLGTSITALAVVRNAADLGMRPMLFDNEHGVAASSRCAERDVIPGAEGAVMCQRLVQFARRGRAWLVATSDTWLRFLIEFRAELDVVFERVLHPANGVLEICLDKMAFARWCVAHDIRAPRVIEPELLAIPEALPFPLMVRPAHSRHGAAGELPKAAHVESQRELKELLARYAAANAQPFVTESLLGRQLSQYAVGAARNGQHILSFVTFKRHPQPAACAVGSLVEVVTDASIEVLGRSMLELLDYQGIAEVEILRDGATGENFVVEVNARPWVQYALGRASGRDLLGFMLGEGTSARATAGRRNARWINISADLYFQFSRSARATAAETLTLREYLSCLRSANVYAYYDRRDPLPFVRQSREFLADALRALLRR